MKIMLVTYLPPTSQNKGGPTALLSYLIKYRPKNIHLDIVCFKGPLAKDESTLKTIWKPFFNNVYFVRPRKIVEIIVKILSKIGFHSAFPIQSYRYSLSKWKLRRPDYSKEIYDILWVYPSYLIKCIDGFQRNNVIVTGPDSASLHYHLMSQIYDISFYKPKDRMFRKKLQRYKILLRQHIHLDRAWVASGAVFHVVGETDRRYIQNISPEANTIFTKHPHFDYLPVIRDFTKATGKLKILVTGVNHGEYIGDFLDEIVNTVMKDVRLAEFYRFMFIGSGFNEIVQRLAEGGFETESFSWVDDYAGTIRESDIQLFPIILGTGTKNKVLSAMATGLLCIGTNHAFENIQVSPGKDCILIENADGVLKALNDVARSRNQFSRMARRASRKVRTMHSPQNASKEFWSLIKCSVSNNIRKDKNFGKRIE
jgi:glycosyltransferase involved in cell wall biosynthesis